MSKNLSAEDVKPVNELVIDEKPVNRSVEDVRPNMNLIGVEPNRTYTQTLTVGMYMGIPPHTYPEEVDVESPFSP